MTDSPGPTLGAPPADPRRIRRLRGLALLSILLLGVISASRALPELLLFACPFWLPYLLLWRRSPEGQKRALGWAVVAGGGGLLITVAAAVIAVLPDGRSSPGMEAQASDYVAPFALLLLILSQAALVWSAIKTFQAARQQPGEKLAIGWPVVSVIFWVLLIVFFPAFPGSHRVERNEVSATSALRTLNTAQTVYADTYKSGFAGTLTKLGPGTGTEPDANHADLVDLRLSGGAEGGTSTGFVKAGYRLACTPGATDAGGRIVAYTITARPIEYRLSGRRSFFTDQSGAIHATSENRAATARDAALQ